MTTPPPVTVERYLRTSGHTIWVDALRDRCLDVLARHMRGGLDVDTACLSLGVAEEMDDPQGRAMLLRHDVTLRDAMIDAIVTKKADINDWYKANGRNDQSTKNIRQEVTSAYDVMFADPATDAHLMATPFPAIWGKLADLLAADLLAAVAVGGLPEWQVMNRNLLSAFFLTCQFAYAKDACRELGNLTQGALGLRGGLIRLVERIGPAGVLDEVPRSAPPYGVVSLQHRGLSQFIEWTEIVANQVPAGAGPLQSTINTGIQPAIPAGAPPEVTPAVVLAARQAMFQEYDYTLLGHMALGAIEQLLRSWAEHVGVQHHRNGVPREFKTWVRKLHASQALSQMLSDIFEAEGGNIRNRVVHGGLLEAGMERLHTARSLISAPAASIAPSGNPYSPTNIAQLCVACLQQVDQEAPAALGANDLAWVSDFYLSNAEIVTLDNGATDLMGRNAEKWRKFLTSYVKAVCPVVSEYFQFGYQGWADRNCVGHVHLPKLLSAVLTLEVVFRCTSHLIGESILWASPPATVRTYRYRMLEFRDEDLCSEALLGRLLGSVETSQRDAARTFVRLAVKTRNALSHGAITSLDERARDALGHSVMKTVQLLSHAGRVHMTRENAYYRWLNARNRRDYSGLADWLHSEQEIWAAIHSPQSWRHWPWQQC